MARYEGSVRECGKIPAPDEGAGGAATDRAGAEIARARVQLLKIQLEETVVRSPVDALVELLDLQPEDLVEPGKPVATLIRTGDLWVRAYLSEDRLGRSAPVSK